MGDRSQEQLTLFDAWLETQPDGKQSRSLEVYDRSRHRQSPGRRRRLRDSKLRIQQGWRRCAGQAHSLGFVHFAEVDGCWPWLGAAKCSYWVLRTIYDEASLI